MIRELLQSAWTRWVGFRYLRSKKNSRFLSFISLISVLGVALGVVSLIVVLSVMDGFESELRARLTGTDLHLLVTPQATAEGFDQGYVRRETMEAASWFQMLQKDPRVSAVWPIVQTEAILKSGKRVTGVVMKGVTAARLDRLKPQLVDVADTALLAEREGAESVRLPSLFVGQELAFEMGVVPGDKVSLISPTETEGPMSSIPRLRRFVVEGVYRSGLPEQELHTVFTSDSAARSFLRRADVVSSWEVTLRDMSDATGLRERLAAMEDSLKFQDWESLNSHLFASLRLERFAMFIVLVFIVVVASFNIVTTLSLMVMEKKREVSILKAMGARDRQVGAIFLSEGIFIGTVGVVLGLIVGFLLCLVLKRYEFIQLPEIYYDRTLPVTFNPLYYLMVPFTALLIVACACLYPSQRAARLRPLDGIRFG